MAWAGASFALVTSSFFPTSLGCSSDERPGTVGDVLEAGPVDEAAVADDAAVPAPGYDGGVGLGLADVPDTPCAARGGPIAVVLPGDTDASAPPPAFRSLQKAGDRRVAESRDGSGFVVFDPDGKNARLVATAPIEVGGATVLGSQIVFGGKRDIKRALVQPYDTSGAPSGASVQLANEYPEVVGGIAIGADDNAALLVWTTRNGVRARGFSAGGAAGSVAYDLAVTTTLNTPSMAVSSVKSGLFAVVFSGFDDGSSYQTAFGRGSSTARIGDPSNLFTGALARTVVGVARTTSGFALLVSVADGANPYAMVVLTDLGGRRTSAGLKLLGTLEASAIAVNGSEIGVLAHRREGDAFASKRATEFRAFDLTGAPLGPWVCMEPPGDQGVVGGGLVADGTGYAAIFGAADGSTSLARFDRLGTGTP